MTTEVKFDLYMNNDKKMTLTKIANNDVLFILNFNEVSDNYNPFSTSSFLSSVNSGGKINNKIKFKYLAISGINSGISLTNVSNGNADCVGF